MKKSLLALAALTAFAGAASAQSSVTLFGVVDLAARRVTNETATGSQSRWTQAQDGIASSRLGFRGVEDIGGGLRAGFWLEAGVNPDTGTTNTVAAQTLGAAPTGTATNITNQTATPQTSSQLFNRRSTISLMGGFGEVRLGRDYTPDFWNHTVFDPFGTNGVGSSVNVFGALNGAGTLVRANNTFGYFLPALGGVYGQVQVAVGEAALGNKHVAGRIGYSGGPVNIAAAFGKTTTSENPTVEWKRFNIAGSLTFGAFQGLLQYNNGKATGGAGNNQEITSILVGANIFLGASTIKASYVKSDGDGPISTRDATQFAVGYQYDLSKRTAVYGTFARIANDGSATYTIGGGPAGQVAGKNSTGFEAGLRHTF